MIQPTRRAIVLVAAAAPLSLAIAALDADLWPLGLGYLLVIGGGQGNTAMVFVAILLLTVIGILAYGAVILVERRVLHYIPRARFQTA